MLLRRHLREDALGDVVVAAPIGRPLGIGELVEIMTTRLGRQAMGYVIDGARIVDRVDFAAVETDRIELGRGGRGGHDRDEAQPQHLGEIRLAHRRRARGGLDHAGVRPDPAIAQRIEEQRTRQPVLEAASRMAAFILQIEGDPRIARQFDPDQMRVRRSVEIRLDPPDGFRPPGAQFGLAPLDSHLCPIRPHAALIVANGRFGKDGVAKPRPCGPGAWPMLAA